MKYAIVESGGKQYKAVEGSTIEVDRLTMDVGKKVDLKDVLLISDGKAVEVGSPLVAGAKVKASVVDHIKGPKVIVFKYHSRKRYRLKKGHRQQYTQLMIEKIETKGEAKKEEKAEAKPAEKPAPKSAPKSAAPKAAAPKTAKKASTKTAAKKTTSTKK